MTGLIAANASKTFLLVAADIFRKDLTSFFFDLEHNELWTLMQGTHPIGIPSQKASHPVHLFLDAVGRSRQTETARFATAAEAFEVEFGEENISYPIMLNESGQAVPAFLYVDGIVTEIMAEATSFTSCRGNNRRGDQEPVVAIHSVLQQIACEPVAGNWVLAAIEDPGEVAGYRQGGV